MEGLNQPNNKNECWQCTFLQTKDIFHPYVSLGSVSYDEPVCALVLFSSQKPFGLGLETIMVWLLHALPPLVATNSTKKGGNTMVPKYPVPCSHSTTFSSTSRAESQDVM